MKLYINDDLIETWTVSGEQVYVWNTTKSTDGIYAIRLIVSDKAGNSVEKIVNVTVDNTLPTATIQTPSEGALLRGTVIINVTGEDVNFEKMELKINDVVVKTWVIGGSHIYLWDTQLNGADGSSTILLTVHDKAGNKKESSVTMFVDNTSPIIETPSWKPEEPSINTRVNVTVKVSDPQPGSGIQSVTLRYKNLTTDEWQSIAMEFDAASGNWTATIPAQTQETTIKFYIEAFDKAGNQAISGELYEYKVIAPAGFPLAWLVIIVLLILAAIAAAIYLWRKRRKREEGIGSSRVENYKLTILLCF